MKLTTRHKVFLLAISALPLLGCHQDMWKQPIAKAQSKDDTFFADSSNSRPTISGTVKFGEDLSDHEFLTGFDKNGQLVKEFPAAVDEEFLKRGQEKYRVFCTPCHGEIGNGKGFIASRGFTMARPVGNYHSYRLRDMPIGHFYDVITNGFGTMFPFKSRIKPADRWAIVAYIRVLQHSQYVDASKIPAEEKTRLDALEFSPDQQEEKEQKVWTPPPSGLRPAGPGTREVPIGRLDRPFPTERSETSSGTIQPSGSGSTNPTQGASNE